MRAGNENRTGNWSQAIAIPLPAMPTDANLEVPTTEMENGLGNGAVLGIAFGAIVAVIAVIACVICTCLCYKRLKRRKELWKVTQVSIMTFV